jgi:RHS repeat-associated protein
LPLNFNPANALTSLLYSGEQFDQRTEMQYLRARYYNPASGTFNRLDPFPGNMQDPQSLHKYLYVHGDPVQGVDPTGRFVSLVGLMIGMAFASQLRKADWARVGVGYRVALGFAVGYGGWQINKMAQFPLWNWIENPALWYLDGQLPGRWSNVPIARWEENVFQALKSKVEPGVHPDTGAYVTREDGESGARDIAAWYVKLTQEIAINETHLFGWQDGVSFGIGGYANWWGDYSLGYKCQDWTSDLQNSARQLQTSLLVKGWDLDFHYHNLMYGDTSLLAFHNFASATFNGGTTAFGGFEMPDLVLDPWARSRPDVFAAEAMFHMWRPYGYAPPYPYVSPS